MNFNMRLTEKTYAKVKSLMVIAEVDTMSLMFRKALAVFGEILKARSEGYEVILRKEGEPDQKLLIT